MKTFLSSKEVQLINGGYLSKTEDKSPVSNYLFETAQIEAHKVIVFAKVAKGKDLKGKKADTIEDIRKEVEDMLSSKGVTYVEAPKEPKMTTTNKMKDEALAFMNFTDDSNKTDRINDYMQKFNVLVDFEEHGLFFEQGVVKLEKIYTVKEITAAVKEIIDLV